MPLRAPDPLAPRRVLHVATTDMSLGWLLGPQLRAFRDAGYEVVTASAPGPFVEDLESEGIQHVALKGATRSFSLRNDLRSMVELFRLFRELKPDIVHTHNPKPGVYGRVAAWFARVPRIVNTQHGLYAQPTDRLARRLSVYGLERIAAMCSDVELVQSVEDVETLRRLRVPARKLRLLGNGIDLDRFSPKPAEVRARLRRELDIADDAIVVGSIGRLVAEKGFRELFVAARAVMEANPKVVFVIVGPQEDNKADAISSQEIRSAEEAGVLFVGQRDDVEMLYSIMDVAVLASHREGFPRTVMEAAANALPVVATDIRGCRQAVDDQVSGLLVAVDNASALEAAISRLVNNDAEREAMGQAGIELAHREFDQQRVIDRTLDAYDASRS